MIRIKGHLFLSNETYFSNKVCVTLARRRPTATSKIVLDAPKVPLLKCTMGPVYRLAYEFELKTPLGNEISYWKINFRLKYTRPYWPSRKVVCFGFIWEFKLLTHFLALSLLMNGILIQCICLYIMAMDIIKSTIIPWYSAVYGFYV